MLEWFFMHLAEGICAVDEIPNKWTDKQHLEEDDFYYCLARNPYLIFLRKYLEALLNNVKDLERVIKVL